MENEKTKPAAEKKEIVNLTVYQAISQVTERLAKEGISKDRTAQTGGNGNYKFRGIDDVYNALAPFLAEAGLTVLPFCLNRDVIERQSAKGNALFYTTVTMRFDFVSKWDNSKHEVCMYGEAMDSGDKGTNKAMSAAFKYACMQAFCIPTEGDNDSENQTHEVKAVIKTTALTHNIDVAGIEKMINTVADMAGLISLWDSYKVELATLKANDYKAYEKLVWAKDTKKATLGG
jgi:hypothetical protein